MAEVTAWQAKPLEPRYRWSSSKLLCVKIKEEAVVRNNAIYLALQRCPTARASWVCGSNTEGAKFWMKVFDDLKKRSVARHPHCCHRWPQGHARGAGDGVSGHHAADVHLIRNLLDYASWKDRKLLAAAIRLIYTAASAEAAEAELDAFARSPWGLKFPRLGRPGDGRGTG